MRNLNRFVSIISKLFLLSMIFIYTTSFNSTIKTNYYCESSVTPEIKALSCKTQDKINTLAALLTSECALESNLGQYMVAQCVLDRTASKHYPDNLEAVIYQRGQFDGLNTKWFYVTNKTYKVARDVIINNKRVVQDTILFYYNPRIATDTSFVKWCNYSYPSIREGNHKFHYKRKEKWIKSI